MLMCITILAENKNVGTELNVAAANRVPQIFGGTQHIIIFRTYHFVWQSLAKIGSRTSKNL